MKFTIYTLGCKVNLYESEVIKEKLLQENFIYTDEENADIFIINTCSVTNMADNKSKKMVRRAKRTGKIVVVCGCSAENKQDEYKNMGIDILIGNKDKSKIAEYLKEYSTKKQPINYFSPEKDLPFEDMEIDKFSTHTRAFVKIQDGCNNFCSYCIIPYVRKNVRNKDFLKAIWEIKTLVKNGHKEIVLTGIHTGSYKGENGEDLADLIHEISKIKGLERIRISSIEITELNEKMLKEIENNKKVVNHFHIPLQAGSDEILKRMNRKYDLDYFKKKIAEIRRISQDVSITTDVIVGHPYETEELFQKTVETCREIGFSKIHVFPYSKRDGTLASRMPMQVDSLEKKKRSHILNELSSQLEKRFLEEHLNKVMDVLIEEVNDAVAIGHTTNYIKVKVYQKLNKNTIYPVQLMTNKGTYMVGNVKEKVTNL